MRGAHVDDRLIEYADDQMPIFAVRIAETPIGELGFSKLSL